MQHDNYLDTQKPAYQNIGFAGLSCRRLMQVDFHDSHIIFEIKDIISNGPHYHVMFELFAVLQDILKLSIEGQNVYLSQGDLILCPNYRWHTFHGSRVQ